MNRHLTIHTLIDMAESEADLAALALGELQSACAAAQRHLEELQRYRVEYGERLGRELKSGIKAAQLANYNSFMSVLDQSIEQQRHVCRRADARCDMARTEWQESQRKLSGYRTLADRMKRQFQIDQGRREQRASDEQASRMLLDQRTADPKAVQA